MIMLCLWLDSYYVSQCRYVCQRRLQAKEARLVVGLLGILLAFNAEFESSTFCSWASSKALMTPSDSTVRCGGVGGAFGSAWHTSQSACSSDRLVWVIEGSTSRSLSRGQCFATYSTVAQAEMRDTRGSSECGRRSDQ